MPYDEDIPMHENFLNPPQNWMNWPMRHGLLSKFIAISDLDCLKLSTKPQWSWS